MRIHGTFVALLLVQLDLALAVAITGTSDQPSTSPSDVPSFFPSDNPSSKPSDRPSTKPSDAPSRPRSDTPSNILSDHPSLFPSDQPSDAPSSGSFPSGGPSAVPTIAAFTPANPLDSDAPSFNPSDTPSDQPSTSPSDTPSATPSINPPSDRPSTARSDTPSMLPSDLPSGGTSYAPVTIPGSIVSDITSTFPSDAPSNSPSSHPSDRPSTTPSDFPSAGPSKVPIASIDRASSDNPSDSPSTLSALSSDAPSDKPSDTPSVIQRDSPSGAPSRLPTFQPGIATESPQRTAPLPSDIPSASPSYAPWGSSSDYPSSFPSLIPTHTFLPSDAPSSVLLGNIPSDQPTSYPSIVGGYSSVNAVSLNAVTSNVMDDENVVLFEAVCGQEFLPVYLPRLYEANYSDTSCHVLSQSLVRDPTRRNLREQGNIRLQTDSLAILLRVSSRVVLPANVSFDDVVSKTFQAYGSAFRDSLINASSFFTPLPVSNRTVPPSSVAATASTSRSKGFPFLVAVGAAAGGALLSIMLVFFIVRRNSPKAVDLVPHTSRDDFNVLAMEDSDVEELRGLNHIDIKSDASTGPFLRSEASTGPFLPATPLGVAPAQIIGTITFQKSSTPTMSPSNASISSRYSDRSNPVQASIKKEEEQFRRPSPQGSQNSMSVVFPAPRSPSLRVSHEPERPPADTAAVSRNDTLDDSLFSETDTQTFKEADETMSYGDDTATYASEEEEGCSMLSRGSDLLGLKMTVSAVDRRLHSLLRNGAKERQIMPTIQSLSDEVPSEKPSEESSELHGLRLLATETTEYGANESRRDISTTSSNSSGKRNMFSLAGLLRRSGHTPKNSRGPKSSPSRPSAVDTNGTIEGSASVGWSNAEHTGAVLDDLGKLEEELDDHLHSKASASADTPKKTNQSKNRPLSRLSRYYE